MPDGRWPLHRPRSAPWLVKIKPLQTRPRQNKIGKTIAERLLAKKLERVVFDRGGFLYHGKVKALADAARAGGLKF